MLMLMLMLTVDILRRAPHPRIDLLMLLLTARRNSTMRRQGARQEFY